MKVIKKLLPVLLVAVILVTVIATSASAAPEYVKAGQETTIEEYLKFNVLKDAGFEDSSPKSLFNSDKPANVSGYSAAVVSELAKVEASSSARPGINHIYAAPGDNSNYYYTVNYDYNTLGADVYNSINLMSATEAYLAEKGIVMEFDVTVFPREDGSSGAPDVPVKYQLLNNLNAMADGYIHFFSIENDPGDATKFMFKAGSGAKSFDQGTWVHVTIQYVPADAAYYVYAGNDEGDGRQCFAKVNSVASSGINVLPIGIRAGVTQAKKGQVSIDNFIAYQSYSVRNPYLYERLNSERKLEMLVDALLDETTPSNIKNTVMNAVNDELLPVFCNGDEFLPSASENARELVTTYKTYIEANKDAIVAEAKLMNLREYQAFIQKLDEEPRSLLDFKNREKIMSDIAEFLENCGDVMATDHEEYAIAVANHDALLAEYAYDLLVKEFVNAATKFTNAKQLGSIVTMKKRLLQAEEAFAVLGTAPTPEMYADHPKTSESVANALSVLEGGYGLVEEMEKDANTTRFIGIVDKISQTSVADWENDDGTIEALWLLALNIKSEGYYTYGMDFAEADMRFSEVNAFFWDKIQQTHIEVLQAKIATFNDVNYIDKEGVCAFIDTYLQKHKNEIDFESAEIKAVIDLNEQYKSKLPDYEKNYKDLLVSNTAAFLSIVKEMDGVTSYTELKEIYERATVYYYAMNLTGEDVMAAMAAYEQAGLELEEMEYASAMYLLAINGITGNTGDDEKYAALYTCSLFADMIDDTYEGVANAKIKYAQLRSEYSSYSDEANECVIGAMDVACSVRSFCSFGDLMQVLINLFTN